jgi:site-specific DNA recombinase
MLAAIYARQSIEKADSVSIDSQVELCKAICQRNGWNFEVYTDVGFSGKNINRPNFERLLNDINSGKIKALVSYKLDRISRSITDFAQLLQFFDKFGVQYISSTEQFDTSSPVGRAMIYIVMVFAQLERETITQRVTDNYRFRAFKGLYMGGNVPLGYTSKKTTFDGRKASVLAVDELSAKTVKDIFSLYLSGLKTHQIAFKLNASGTGTSKKKSYTSNAVLRILRNFTYCCNSPEVYEYIQEKGYEIENGIEPFDGRHGMCCYFKSHDRNKPSPLQEQLVAVGLHEPIIAAKEWIAVQKKIDVVKDSPRRTKSSARSWLSGLMKCAECGHSFGLKFTCKSSGKYAYYFCRGRAGRGVATCSNDLWVNAAELEERIEQILRTRAKSLLNSGKAKVVAPVEDSEHIVKIKRELADCKSQIKNLMSNIGKGNEIINRHITEYITDLDVKCHRIEMEINVQKVIEYEAKATTLNKDYLMEVSKNMLELFSSESIAEKNRMARVFIKYMTIDREGSINVKWLI